MVRGGHPGKGGKLTWGTFTSHNTYKSYSVWNVRGRISEKERTRSIPKAPHQNKASTEKGRNAFEPAKKKHRRDKAEKGDATKGLVAQ